MDNNFSDIIKNVCRSVTGKQKRAEIEEELLGHLEDTYERNKLIGKSDEDAQNEAIAALGDLDVLRERLGALHSFSHAKAASSAINIFIFSFLLSNIYIINDLKPVFLFISGTLMIFALVRLKTVNKKLNTAFFAHTASFALTALYKSASVYAPSDIAVYIYTALLSVLTAVVWYCAFAGLHELYKKFCPDEKKKPHLMLPAILLSLASLAGGGIVLMNDGKDIEMQAIFIPALILIFYIFIAVQLIKLKKRLWDADAEYGISPWRKVSTAAVCLITVSCIACPMGFMVAAATKTPQVSELVIHDTENTNEAEEIRKHVISLGMPEEVADELSDSEIMRYKDAVHMEMSDQSGYGYFCQLFDFYFARGEAEYTEYTVRTLMRLQPANEDYEYGYYRCGVFHDYYNNGIQTSLIILSDPDCFVSIQQKRNGKIYVQETLAADYENIRFPSDSCGFEFKLEEDQTVYFALTNCISNPYERFSYGHGFLLLRQKKPFVYQYNTVTDFAHILTENSLLSASDPIFDSKSISDGILFEPEFVGLAWADCTEEY